MSSCTRAARRRDGRARAKVPEWSIVAGWCQSEAELDETRQETHDTVIRLLGARRRGGVRWAWYPDRDDAYEALDQLTEGASPELSDHYRQLRGLLREHGGILVLAMAPGAPA